MVKTSKILSMNLENFFILAIGAFLIYHFFIKRCSICGLTKAQCKCKREYFTPLDTIHTSLDESINNPSCCISNTAGYVVDPIAVSGAAPGFSTISAYANPCN